MITTIATTASVALVTWFISRREYKAKVVSLELINTDKLLKLYRENLAELIEEVAAAKETIKEMKAQNQELAKVNRSQALRITELIETNEHLVKKLEQFKQLK